MDNRVKKLFGAVCVFGFFYLFVYTSLAFGSSSQKDYESNRVVIRVWNTESVSDIAKGASVGHASIEIPKFEGADGGYVSFWPGRPVRGLLDRPPGTFNELEGDYLSEDQRQADNIICLYSLNVDKIRDKFLEFKMQIQADPTGSKTGWTLLGDSRLIWNGSNQHSCASLALSLLKVGDIGSFFLISAMPAKAKTSYSVTTSPSDKVVKVGSSVVTPNLVADVALKARKIERESNSAIRPIPLFRKNVRFTYSGALIEYEDIENPFDHQSPGICNVM